MVRIVLGVIAGFFVWMIAWVGAEKLISAIWPAFGAHQAAFQSAIENGSEFGSDPTMLLVHIVLGSAVSMIAGFLSAMIAGENRRAPMMLGVLLLLMGVLKAMMSWQLVPIWYHLLFTLTLLPMTLVGGRLRTQS